MKGFTLIEILVSISIFAVLATMVYGSLNAVLSKNDAITGGVSAFEMARNTLSRMSLDMKGIFVEQYPEYQAPGITDPPDPYRIFGETSYTGGKETSRLRFASTGHLPISSDIVSGLARITYYADRSPERDDDTLIIRRSDIPYPYDIDPNQDPDTKDDPILCERVESFALTYVDEDGQTHQQWDSDSETYRFATPRAVIVEITVAGESGTHEFSTRIDIPVYRKRLENVRR